MELLSPILSLLPALSSTIALPAAVLFTIAILRLIIDEVQTILTENFAKRNQIKIWDVVLSGDAGIANFKMPKSLWRQILLRKIIIREILRHGGEARQSLVKLYRHLGFEHYEKRALGKTSILSRIEAIAILGYIGNLEDRLLLKDALDDSSNIVRFSAAISLIKLSAREYTQKYLELLVTLPPNLAQMLLDPLKNLGDCLVKPTLDMLKKPLSNAARKNLLALLGEFKTADIASLLFHYAHNADDELRIEAVKLLAGFDSLDAAENLTILLKDPLWQVRAQAAKSLANSKQEFIYEPLRKALSDQNYWVRLNSANTLASLGERGRELLVETTISEDLFAAEIARQTLERLATPPSKRQESG
ncbi:MAG: hypothetical protein Kow0090_09860 [Myxococcota bacterium]